MFFNIGLVLSLSLVLLAFEWKTVEQVSTVNLEGENSLFLELIEDIPQTRQPAPPPPVIRQPQVISVPDEVEIEVELDIDLDLEMTEEQVIEQTVFEQPPEEEEADEFFTIVEKMPTFPGGMDKFHRFVGRNLKYPKPALRAGVEGKVMLEFVIEETGEISHVKVIKGIGFGCDEEAKRVMESSPKWNPGMQRNQRVKVKSIVSMMFALS